MPLTHDPGSDREEDQMSNSSGQENDNNNNNDADFIDDGEDIVDLEDVEELVDGEDMSDSDDSGDVEMMADEADDSFVIDEDDDDADDGLPLHPYECCIQDESEVYAAVWFDQSSSQADGSSSNSIICEGGKADKAVFWSLSGEKLLEDDDHKDSISHIAVSHVSWKGSKCIAVADMSGHINIFHKDFALLCQFDCDDVSWLRWHPSALVLLVGCTDCSIWVLLAHDKASQMKTVGSPSNCDSGNCGQFISDNSKALCGFTSQNGTVCVCDLKSGSVVSELQLMSKSDIPSVSNDEGISVVQLAIHTDNVTAACGTNVGTVHIINTLQMTQVLWSFSIGNCGVVWVSALSEDVTDQFIEVLDFIGDTLLVVSLSGKILKCSLRNHTILGHGECEDNVSCAMLFPSSSSFLIGHTNGYASKWDLTSLTSVERYKLHRMPVLDLVLSPNRDKLMSYSEDGQVHIYDTESMLS